MKCTHCGHESSEGAEFCGKCGQPLRIENKCSQCGHTNPPGNNYCEKCGHVLTEQAPAPTKQPSPQPTSFANGRYQVRRFLGEGGKKRVYLAHDATLDRDVAFALIKTEKLDEVARTRIKREARAMGKLGDHPNIVTVYDFGDHEGQPYMVLPLLPGGDVEGLIEKAPDHRLPLDKSLEIAKAVCKGLEFAHSKGIVHRDLKPGNVWLSADGTAKIGDFGLAVAVDLSRLTQSGMMVGTVSYMPPEQAMGGKVTAQADLYSLGAMLYEMVTGRPPFVGDDSVSIIGQHINTPPVSPAWHRADLPPALETLIMQLLEKDPDKRPESASIVLQALESIEAGKAAKEPSKESTITENPLYRRVFVGREPELRQLQTAFDGAMSGQGALMMVVGEPGIGKTAICDQLKTFVTLRGGKTLLGHCYEEGSLSLPYLAFVEAMRSYVLSREVKDLREELGTGAADVARIVSEIRERLKVKPRPQKDPEEERYRLMQAVTSFLTNAAGVQPLLIVLEDLHDADKGTLEMLTHISRHLSKARLLIIGTYRDVEVDRTHPLSAALAELRRVATYGRVILRGLNPDEVRRMLEGITREEIPWNLAEAVQRQTEGNPLFVQEVVRYLAEEGLITQKEGKWRPTKDTPLEMNIPEGLRDVIGKRLSLLSKECNQLLSVASVIGREFSLETLKAVENINEDVFVNALKEAVQLSVLEERTQVGQVKYRFTHAFFRQTLYEELIAPQRLKLHQQVARALETQYAKRLEEHAAELAEHSSQSTDPADLKKAVEYGEMAAKRSLDVYAYGEAVRLLEQALKVQKVLDPADKAKICDLLLDLAGALSLGGEAKRALEVELEEAFSLAQSIDDKIMASRTCEKAILDMMYTSDLSFDALSGPKFARWVERADRCAKPDTITRVMANQGKAISKYMTGLATGKPGLVKESAQSFIDNVEMAKRLNDPEILWIVACSVFIFVSGPRHMRERQLLAEELAGQPRAGITTRILGTGLLMVAYVLLESGQRQLAGDIYRECREIIERSEQTNLWFMTTALKAMLATIDGRLEEADETGRQIRARGQELDFTNYAALQEYYGCSSARVWLGKPDEIVSLIGSFANIEILGQISGSLLTLIKSHAEIIEYLDRNVLARPGIGTPDDETSTAIDVSNLELAVLVRHHKAAELLLDRLEEAKSFLTILGYLTCPARHLGGAAALLGRYDQARKYYREAIKVCTEMPFRPELALSHLQLAELLLEHYPDEKKEALEHLDFAIKEFREMKMQPSLERALKHKDILKA